jgi:hypothetical protein
MLSGAKDNDSERPPRVSRRLLWRLQDRVVPDYMADKPTEQRGPNWGRHQLSRNENSGIAGAGPRGTRISNLGDVARLFGIGSRGAPVFPLHRGRFRTGRWRNPSRS